MSKLVTTHDLINACAELFRAHDLVGSEKVVLNAKTCIPDVPMVPPVYATAQAEPPTEDSSSSLAESLGPAAAAPTHEWHDMGVPAAPAAPAAEGMPEEPQARPHDNPTAWWRYADALRALALAAQARVEELQRAIPRFEALQHEVEALRTQVHEAYSALESSQQSRKEEQARASRAERERDEAAKDAQRYRWLMANGGNWQVTIGTATYTGNQNWLDAQYAIDAAISAMQAGEQK